MAATPTTNNNGLFHFFAVHRMEYGAHQRNEPDSMIMVLHFFVFRPYVLRGIPNGDVPLAKYDIVVEFPIDNFVLCCWIRLLAFYPPIYVLGLVREIFRYAYLRKKTDENTQKPRFSTVGRDRELRENWKLWILNNKES
jgi:hypothetical protein